MQGDIPLCPILTPTIAEFADFSSFVEKTERQYSKEYGMVKIIPPPEWKPKSQKYSQILQKLKIPKPEYQSLYGNKNNYFFTCKNQKCESLSLDDFKQMAKQKEKDVYAFKNIELIEKYFWNKFSVNRELYCANVQKTLMDQNAQQWEFHQLKSFFSQAVTEHIHGLNTSFLFVGAWKTVFNWHIEDLDLSAINYLHQGAPKMWYAIHPQDRKKFEQILSTLFTEENNKCSNFMRHKQCFLNIYKLKEKYPYLRVSKMYQNEGEISLAFAQAYHSGFNMGFNIAEAVNYGNRDWLQRYSKFRPCKCPLQIGVKLDHQQMIKNLEKSPFYQEIKDTKAFQKIKEKVSEECKPDQLFQEANSEEIEIEIQKAKKRPENRGKDKVFVPKYNKYFPSEKPLFMQCDECQNWRKVTQEVCNKYSKQKVQCKDLGFQCTSKPRKRAEKQPKEKKIVKREKQRENRSRRQKKQKEKTDQKLAF